MAAAAAEAAWKKFTPAQVDSSKCVARTWSGGCGGQCSKPRTKDNELCTIHSSKDSWKSHGRVDGPIPEAKLLEFNKVRAPKAPVSAASTPAAAPASKRKAPAAPAEPVAKRGRAGSKPPPAPKDPNAPKRPVGGAFGVFMNENRASIKASLPADHKITEIPKKASELWKAKSEEDKKPFQQRYEAKMAECKNYAEGVGVAAEAVPSAAEGGA